MNALPRLLAIVSFLLLTTGCVYVGGEHMDNEDWRVTQRDNREAISSLEIGITRLEVMERLGVPNDSEAFSSERGEVRVLFYRTQRRHSDGDTTRDETTPLVFRNDVLIGWGQGVYSDLKRSLI